MLEAVKTVFPKAPTPTFIPNEPVYFSALNAVDWPKPIRPHTTQGVRVPRPIFPHYDMGAVDDEYNMSIDPTLEALAYGEIFQDPTYYKGIAVGALAIGLLWWWKR